MVRTIEVAHILDAIRDTARCSRTILRANGRLLEAGKDQKFTLGHVSWKGYVK
jgi:hypothetical protein